MIFSARAKQKSVSIWNLVENPDNEAANERAWKKRIVEILCAIRFNIHVQSGWGAAAIKCTLKNKYRTNVVCASTWKRWERFFCWPKNSHRNGWDWEDARDSLFRQFCRLAADNRNLKSSTRCNNSHTYKKYMHSTGPVTPTWCMATRPTTHSDSHNQCLSAPRPPSASALSRRVLNETLNCCWRTWMKTVTATAAAEKKKHIADIARATSKYGTTKTRFRFTLPHPLSFSLADFFFSLLFSARILLRFQFRLRCAQPFR